MDSKEFRIGNCANYYSDKINFKLVTIDVEDLERIDSHDDDIYQPIPLTEAWLLKLLNPVEGGEYYYNGFSCQFSGIEIVELMMDGDYIPCNTIQYVHQLQNLFHALTGQELQIKEI